MMRNCHKNTCPVGVATQDPALRKNFSGKPEYLVNFMHFIAAEVREIMASLGMRTFDELVGRSDLLDTRPGVEFWKARGLDFTKIFHQPAATPGTALPVRWQTAQDHGIAAHGDWEIIKLAQAALDKKELVRIERPIRNVDRSVGTILAGTIAKRYGLAGLPPDTIHCKFTGSAGQSFGAFCVHGMFLELEGEANDYLGKGCSGGRLAVYPPRKAAFRAERNVIAGNTLLYGATDGEIFIRGVVGERFAIRNSGAVAVVEGVGDHGCEYMTGGRVVILGRTGLNFAAGMSGGLAFVYDEDQTLDQRANLDMVDLDPVIDPDDITFLQAILKRHITYTGSAWAQTILDDWANCLPYFIKVFPMEYRKVLGRMSREDAETERAEVVHG
jgi:glutamate synthase (NADPH/NADH) large chain